MRRAEYNHRRFMAPPGAKVVALSKQSAGQICFGASPPLQKRIAPNATLVNPGRDAKEACDPKGSGPANTALQLAALISVEMGSFYINGRGRGREGV